ncbi:MAG: hypothetical protein PHS57_05775 [Alphaproteobacteria bacterium]|nr:hypothetical protein [Alphaproteobacteria bacterium]
MGVEQLIPLGRIAFNTPDAATGVKVGKLPKGWVVVGFLTRIKTAFNAASSNAVLLGIEDNTDEYLDGDDTVAGTTGYKTATTVTCPFDVGDADIDVYAAYTQTGTAATAGVAEFWAKVVKID